MAKRKRRYYSEKRELITKSRESALAAIQVFNNPLITFKSESFIVLMIISWTYLLHAYYKSKKVDYRERNNAKKLVKTKCGAYKLWSLGKCLDIKECPLEEPIKENLKFLLAIRHEIEHQMTQNIDHHISGKFQACCINYNQAVKDLFPLYAEGLEKCIPFSLQLFSFGEEQISEMKNKPDLPKNILDFISKYEKGIENLEDPKYSYRVIYLRENATRESAADIAYRFVPEDSPESRQIHNILVKNKKLIRLMEKDIVDIIKSKGYSKFTSYHHQRFWKTKWNSVEERNEMAENEGFGELVTTSQWMWYKEKWIPEVTKYCKENANKFK